MIVNSKFLHYPPYISTNWKQVAALHMNGNTLIINLHNQELIQIPNLTSPQLDVIFKAYGDYLELESLAPLNSLTPASTPFPLNPLTQALISADFSSNSPFQFGITGIDGLASSLQHNQAQANMPDLPHEVIHKIASIAKIISPAESQDLPKAEPHCNCMYCQIARAISNAMEGEPEKSLPLMQTSIKPEEPAQQWSIHQKGELMFEVTDKQNALKKFNVFLGNPMGCTCGQEGCEHLIAVLKS